LSREVEIDGRVIMHVEKMQAYRVQNLVGKRRKLGKTGRTWQIILKWILRTGTECKRMTYISGVQDADVKVSTNFRVS
jgi:hypothetical protein